MAKQYYQGETFDNVAPDFLHDAEFNDCTFINCRWSGARITACSFLGCTFDRCAWSDVVFSFCQMSDAWLLHCAFRSIAWGGLQGRSALVQPFGRAEQCEFRYNEFSGMALKQFDFSKCTSGGRGFPRRGPEQHSVQPMRSAKGGFPRGHRLPHRPQ